jgi:acyl phosphate:glycerol-3-phosphate acyltransferase
MVLAAVVGYLLGSFPSGYLIGRAKGVDVRRHGSGATGGTNVLRTLGAGPAVATGLLDLGKGMLGAYIGFRLAGDVGYALGGFAALTGHSYPVWLRFKGGKSVATGAGALVLFHPWAFLAGLVSGVAAIIPTRWVSLGSLVGGLFFCGTVMFSPAAPAAHKLLAAGTLLVVYVRHWENMKRIAAGTENRFGQKAKPRTEQ